MEKTYSFIMLALLMIAAMSFTACGGDDDGSSTTYDKTGRCGDNVTYKYSEATGLLIIQGNGAMSDGSSKYEAPWDTYKEKIKTVVIGEGVTSIESVK